MVRVHTYFIEQHKQHDDTTRVACNITTTTTIMMMRRLADVDHHARGHELRGVSTSPEAWGRGWGGCTREQGSKGFLTLAAVINRVIIREQRS